MKPCRQRRNFIPGISDTLVYRVYDIVDESMTFVRRFNLLQDIVTACKNPNIILARTETAHTEADILRLHAEFTAEGFEGSIIRNNDGKYTINKRSNDLLKHKDWLDEEFLIVNIIPSGGGIAETVGKFVCVDEKGHEFESTAMGSFEQRQEYLTNKHLYIGKWAKVKYRERSGKHNVPFHSNTLEVRDREDF
jgi:ATP-dependent DNA ligase